MVDGLDATIQLLIKLNTLTMKNQNQLIYYSIHLTELIDLKSAFNLNFDTLQKSLRKQQ